MRLWIRNPLAILAENAGGGVVIEDGVIVELITLGGFPSLPVTESFDASDHVVLPGLVNTHHHFYQTLTRAHPAARETVLENWKRNTIVPFHPGALRYLRERGISVPASLQAS